MSFSAARSLRSYRHRRTAFRVASVVFGGLVRALESALTAAILPVDIGLNSPMLSSLYSAMKAGGSKSFYLRSRRSRWDRPSIRSAWLFGRPARYRFIAVNPAIGTSLTATATAWRANLIGGAKASGCRPRRILWSGPAKQVFGN